MEKLREYATAVCQLILLKSSITFPAEKVSTINPDIGIILQNINN
jgi:hypothetical protein